MNSPLFHTPTKPLRSTSYPGNCFPSLFLLFSIGLAGPFSIQAGQFTFQIVDSNNIGLAGEAAFDPNGVGYVGSEAQLIFGALNLADYNIPGPGPMTGKDPTVAALFQLSVDPSSITSDDFDPDNNPNQAYSYAMTANLDISAYGLPPSFVYPLYFHVDASLNYLDANPGWVLVNTDNGQDTWAQSSINLSTGIGYIAIASTGAPPIAPYEHFAEAALISGGSGTITYSAVPESNSLVLIGLCFGATAFIRYVFQK